MTPAVAELTALGATTRLSAQVRDQNGRVMAGASVAWSSSSASVATVDGSELVTAAANGAATITATSGAASGTAAVTVAQKVSSVAVTPAADTLVAFGDTVRLVAEATDVNGHAVLGSEFTWASSDTAVARVDGEGLVTAGAAGDAQIAATSSGVMGHAALTVAAAEPTTVAVTPDTIAFTAVGQTVQLAAEVHDQIGRPMENVPVSWSSNDTLVATVDSAGLVTAVGGGVTTTTANAGDVTGAAVVSVIQSAASVTLLPAADTIAPADTLQLVAEAFDENGHRVQGAEFDWTSSDEAIVRVGESGLVTAVGEGRATVTATVGEASAASEITVENPDRAALVALYHATDGPNWVDSDNWLTDAPLGEWYGVRTDASGRVARLHLIDNKLDGPIPPEVGQLTRLESLNLGTNKLTDPIPLEIGKLSDLTLLGLHANNFKGPLPPELGQLSKLTVLYLHRNDLTATLPSWLLGLLDLLGGVRVRRVGRCGGSSAKAYVTQAVQSPEFPVPLVANEEALLRVFVTAARSNNLDIPPVRATLYANGVQVHVLNVPGKPGPIPTEVWEGNLAASANAGIPGHLVRPGLEIVIEVDPEGTLDPALGVTKRIPETGRLAVDVRAMPFFDLTVIPFLWTESSDSSILDITRDLSPESDLLWETRTLLPVDDFAVTVHAPVLSSSNNAYALLNETGAIRVMEGASGHYLGTMSPPVTGGALGVANLPGRASFSIPVGWIMAHELGHNMSLEHPYQNPLFPSYPRGRIGAWGYDFRDGGRLVSPDALDIMEGCCWISDFHFGQSLAFRAKEAAAARATQVAEPSRAKSLLLWGGLDRHGVPYLDPAFVVEAAPSNAVGGGEYTVEGTTADGTSVFSFNFDMPVTADAEGEEAGFVFALPVQPGWEGNLASITLSGPGGSVTLDEGSDRPTAILRDPRNGQVRGFLRGPPTATQAAADAAATTARGLEVLFSRGIPGADAWRR